MPKKKYAVDVRNCDFGSFVFREFAMIGHLKLRGIFVEVWTWDGFAVEQVNQGNKYLVLVRKVLVYSLVACVVY